MHSKSMILTLVSVLAVTETPVGNVSGNLTEPYRQIFLEVSGFIGTRVVSSGQRFNVLATQKNGTVDSIGTLGHVVMSSSNTAVMTFYTNRINSDSLMRTVSLHEWLHVLGYGTIQAWEELTPSNYFIGTEFTAVHGKTAKTQGGHWSPSEKGRLEDDVMKPTVQESSVLSPETLAALKDLHPGWTLNTCERTYDCQDGHSCYDTTNFGTGYCSKEPLRDTGFTLVRAFLVVILVLISIAFAPE